VDSLEVVVEEDAGEPEAAEDAAAEEAEAKAEGHDEL
jgi:hypothetical protein